MKFSNLPVPVLHPVPQYIALVAAGLSACNSRGAGRFCSYSIIIAIKVSLFSTVINLIKILIGTNKKNIRRNNN